LPLLQTKDVTLAIKRDGFLGGSGDHVPAAPVSEPFGREHTGLSPKHFGVPGLWRDLPNLRRLAEQIAGPVDPFFACLHAAQLIKHVLAADQAFGPDFSLIYFFHDVCSEAGAEHRREIKYFSTYLRDDGVSFRAVAHQDYLLRLAEQERAHHPAFIDWLVERYL
jgi:hypothetical protein